MKPKVIIFFLLSLFLLSCKQSHQGEQPEPHWLPNNTSRITGKLQYVVNPFEPEDTILCVKNAYVHFHLKVDDKNYCSYLRDLFSTFEGRLTECRFHTASVNEHSWEFFPTSEMCFYPTRNGEFISLMDANSGHIVDSICIFATEVNDVSATQWTVTIYTSFRQTIDSIEPVTSFYMGDYADFSGNDYMHPKFITDSITPSGEKIVCFDSQYGPQMSKQIVDDE